MIGIAVSLWEILFYGRDATVGGTTDVILREDSGGILREDGSYFIRET